MMRIRKHNLDRQLFKNKPRDNIKIENELSRNISQRSLSLWVDTLDFYSMSLDLSVSAALLLPPLKNDRSIYERQLLVRPDHQGGLWRRRESSAQSGWPTGFGDSDFCSLLIYEATLTFLIA